MKFIKVILNLLLIIYTISFSLHSANIEIVRFKNMEDKDFANIKEFFSGIEDQSYRSVFRTDNAQRVGFYFIIKLDKKISNLTPNTQIELDWIPYGKLQPESMKHKIRNQATGSEILVGLTGEDAPEDSKAPLAWRVRLLDSENNILSQEQSFLWQ